MNPAKVERDRVRRLQDLPNVGPAMAKDLELIGIKAPNQLAGKDPLKLYQSLCRKRGIRQDPLCFGRADLHHPLHGRG